MTQAEPSAELAAAFAAHAKAYGLKPGQQVNVLLLFVTVQTLFPEISLQQFLSRLPTYYQANDDNRLFPKAALDHHCPTAGSACPPAKRISYLLEYLAYVSRARLGNETIVSLDAFLTFVLADVATVPSPEVATTPTPVPDVPAPVATAPQLGPPPVVVTDAAVPGPLPAFSAPSVATEPVSPPVASPPVALPPTPTPSPETAAVPAVGQVFNAILSLKAADHRQIEGYLTTPGRLGTVAAGDMLVSHSVDYGPAILYLDIVNSDPPYVDIYVRAKDEQNTIIADVPPIEGRSSVIGEYTVRAKDGSFTIALKVT